MKRPPLKRKTPLKATKGLDRGSGELKRTPLKARSKKRSDFMRDVRAPAVRKLVEEGAPCEVGAILAGFCIDAASNCRGVVEGLHERRKRSAAGSLVNPANLLGACSPCNGLVEDEPLMIRELTGTLLVVLPGDDEWEALGARNDP